MSDIPVPEGPLPLDTVRQLMAAARQHGVRRLLVRTAGTEIEIETGRPAPTPEPAAPEPDREPGPELVDVAAPAVGVVHLVPGGNGSPAVAVGSLVAPDDQVAQIEAMKMTTAVLAGHAGVVREICVRDGEVVQFGQPLLRLDTTGGEVPHGAR